MRRGVLWDSSAILALLDADDADHNRAVAAATRIAAHRRPSFITNYIEAETHALLLCKLGRALAREWLLAGGLPVVRGKHSVNPWRLAATLSENSCGGRWPQRPRCATT